MIPQILIDKAETPDGGKELRLYRHDKDFLISVGNLTLMSSRTHESEEALARLSIPRIEKKEQPCVLIGGLGMGFTLRAALDGLPVTARVVVAELVPAVVKWNRGPLAALAGDPLSDGRVEVHEVDAAKLIKANSGSYDAILLDVDNGPAGLTRHGNFWFYGTSGLQAILRALRPEGVLALWSAGQDVEFTRRMEKAGFQVEAVRVRARSGGKGAHHLIWIATKKAMVPAKGKR
ncbi:MAG TPA: spermidine synthase [Candidatus Omnitrophota bacterium]|nr:spermidine synthase [Candidatus Omnitrophota bacterium]HPS37745.1 spermidine synthase [Candidatus Omnitrophota bacterium]